MANSLNKITTKSILDATVATADIADDAVTAAKIASGSGLVTTNDAQGATLVGTGAGANLSGNSHWENT